MARAAGPAHVTSCTTLRAPSAKHRRSWCAVAQHCMRSALCGRRDILLPNRETCYCACNWFYLRGWGAPRPSSLSSLPRMPRRNTELSSFERIALGDGGRWGVSRASCNERNSSVAINSSRAWPSVTSVPLIQSQSMRSANSIRCTADLLRHARRSVPRSR